jgi:hypothetical protein
VLIDTNQEGEATIPLQEAFGISGKVLDAETRQPIPEFKLTWGYSYGEEEDFFQWQPRAALVGSNGTYTVTLEQAYWPRIRLMAEADGYAPAATQSFPPHGKHTFDFELKQGKGLSGVVELPNGEPLDRVRVYLTENSTSVYMSEEGRIQPRVARSRNMATDAKGRFQFPPVLEPWSIIVAHDNGYAEAKASEVAETGKVVLQPWARVRGVVKVGPKPEQNQSAYLQNMLYRYGEGGRRFPALALYIEKKLEADGSFVFEKVPPGERKIVLRYKFREGSGAIPLSHSVVFSARAGETAEVTLGGTGRPVVGKVKVVEGDAGGVDWMRDVHSLTTKFAESPDNKPSEVPESASQEERMAIYKKHSAEQRAFWTSEAGHAIERRTCTYVLVFKPDGSFRAENVPAGTYQLNIVPTDPTAEQYRFAPLGSLSKEVVVPEAPASQTDEPFDLGEIELKIRK